MIGLITVILLPALAAFLLLTQLPSCKWYFLKQSAERSIFWILIVAVSLNFLSAILIEAGRDISDLFCYCSSVGRGAASLFEWFEDMSIRALKRAIPGSTPDIVTVVSLLISGLIAASFWCWSKLSPESYKMYDYLQRRKAINVKAARSDAMEGLFMYSFDEFMPLMFNLKNGKVYIGWVTSEEIIVEQRKSVAIFLIASGYREKETMHFQVETYYWDVIDALLEGLSNESDKEFIHESFALGKVIQMSEIVTVTPWLPIVYEKVHDAYERQKKGKGFFGPFKKG